MKNYYTLLGLSRGATTGEIKRAFRKLAFVYHPDRNPSPEARSHFQAIKEAYEVLGDWERRKLYDFQLDNPVVPLITDQQKHRDPRYRPKPAGYRAQKKITATDLMAKYLPYVRWVSFAGLALVFLITVDLLLPRTAVDEQVASISKVTSIHNDFSHFAFRLVSGKEINVYSYDARYLSNEQTIRYYETLIFRTVMYISDTGPLYQVRVAYIYSKLVFFPVLLAITCVLAFIYRKGIEFPFNLNLVGGMLFIITLTLLIAL